MKISLRESYMKKIFLKKLLHEHLFGAFVIMLGLEYMAYLVFGGKENIPILASISTGLVVMFGYFATHYLTLARNQREKKLEQYVELIKTLRFFILETDLKGTKHQKKMRDDLQDSYFAFSLLTSSKSYDALLKMMETFQSWLESEEEIKIKKGKLDLFKEAQSNFVNELRNEFVIDEKIDFETFDFILPKDKTP